MIKKATKQTKGAVTREKILNAAKKVFSKHPYHAASMRMIGQEAGIDHPLISYYFAGKNELYKTIMKCIFEELILLNRECFQDYKEESIAGGFKKYINRLIEYNHRNPVPFRIFALNVPQQAKITQIPGYDYLTEYVDKICSLFEDAFSLKKTRRELQMYINSFSFLLVAFLGAEHTVARVQGLEPASREYIEWIKDTLTYIFLPRFTEIIKQNRKSKKAARNV